MSPPTTARWNAARNVAVVLVAGYLIAFYAFDLPYWVKLGAGVILGVAWLSLYIGLPMVRWLRGIRLGRS
jgi:hypothetical protein